MRVCSTRCFTRSFGAAATPALLSLACAACSASAPVSSDDASIGVGVGATANPDGVPYPSPPSGYGHKARTGTTPGSVIQNFSFLGYPNGDKSKGLQTISLANYYDPCGRRLKLLHIAVGGVWCTPCQEETVAMVAAKATLTSEQVVVVQALGDGPTIGTAATTTDLDNWTSRYMANFTEVLDPGYANFGAFFNTASPPWNCDVDPRTMEILHASSGWPGDINTELQPALALVGSAAGYPIPAVCGDP
jgi:hypothetical protein